MARNKRQRKKAEKKQLTRQLVASGKYTEKQAKKINYTDSKSIVQTEQKRQQKREYNRRYREKTHNEKISFLKSKGLDPTKYKKSQIDRIKLKDIRQNNFDRSSYPHFFGIKNFDFNKVYRFKGGSQMYIAYRDFAGETSFAEALEEFSQMSNAQLMDRLEQISQLYPSYNKRGADSNGSAGDYKFIISKRADIITEQQDVYNRNRRKKTKSHGGDYKGFQALKSPTGRTTYKEATPRKMLIMANAIMHNVTEYERIAFYKSFYFQMNKHMPEFGAILPPPIQWGK